MPRRLDCAALPLYCTALPSIQPLPIPTVIFAGQHRCIVQGVYRAACRARAGHVDVLKNLWVDGCIWGSTSLNFHAKLSANVLAAVYRNLTTSGRRSHQGIGVEP